MWPWSTAIAHAGAGSTGLGALSADDFHRDGRRPNEVTADPAMPKEDSASPLWAVAAAAAGRTAPRSRPDAAPSKPCWSEYLMPFGRCAANAPT